MTIPRGWKKSSRSQNGSECVEVASDLAAIRDSKNPATVLDLPRAAVSNLVRSLSR